MITFWIAAILTTGLALGLMAALAARPIPVAADPARSVYRRQLGEIDDMAARGLLGEDERKSAYAEAARRLIGEEDPQAEKASPPGARLFVWGGAAATGILAILIYLTVGHPGLPDQPYAARLTQWKAQFVKDPESIQPAQAIAILEQQKVKTPDDPQLLAFLADLQMSVGNTLAAERNLERSAQLAPKVAETWDHLGQAQVDLAKGEIGPDARKSLETAITLDPKAVMPRYLLADNDINNGKVPQGVAALRAMLPDLNPDQRTEIEGRIADVEKGESAVAGANAPPFVLAMVQGLVEKLKANPDNVDGWERLVRAYTVLKDQKALDGALAQAGQIYKDRPRDLAAIKAAINTVASSPIP